MQPGNFARALPHNQAILWGRIKLPGLCANVTRFQWFFFAHNFSYITFLILKLQTWNLRCTHLVSKTTFTAKHIDLSLLLLMQYSVKRKFAENARNRPGRRYRFSIGIGFTLKFNIGIGTSSNFGISTSLVSFSLNYIFYKICEKFIEKWRTSRKKKISKSKKKNSCNFLYIKKNQKFNMNKIFLWIKKNPTKIGAWIKKFFFLSGRPP